MIFVWCVAFWAILQGRIKFASSFVLIGVQARIFGIISLLASFIVIPALFTLFRSLLHIVDGGPLNVVMKLAIVGLYLIAIAIVVETVWPEENPPTESRDSDAA